MVLLFKLASLSRTNAENTLEYELVDFRWWFRTFLRFFMTALDVQVMLTPILGFPSGRWRSIQADSNRELCWREFWRKVRAGAMFCVVVQDLTMLLKENKRADIRPLLLTAFLVRPGRQLSSRG